MTITPEDVINIPLILKIIMTNKMKKQITKVYLTKTSLTTQILHNEKDDHKKIKIVTTNNYTGLTIHPHNYHKKTTHRLPPIKTKATHNK